MNRSKKRSGGAAARAGRNYAPNFLEQLQEAKVRGAEAYLESVAARLKKDRLHVDTHVLTGDVAANLIRITEIERCDLIVMGSHGLSGHGRHVYGRHVYGSAAQKVLHSSRRPSSSCGRLPQNGSARRSRLTRRC